ncbi:ubiquinone biosynthesis protein COQ4 [Qipengyuania sediminis]|uniref:ubiquinone biosynthesis protein COQ4 n=1 Tax=Qipengyuania sediminis TaxID=1532023 RepID=UPI001F110656|nr:ubiquinone biosynthesis protein COQ4 [Qipengyuania sediminis]
MKSRTSQREAERFIRSAEGQRFLAAGTDIPAMLDDHARWAKCGPDTVAASYIAFMRREGLSAAGLVAESEKWLPKDKRLADLTQWYYDRLRDTHDLFHVLTGYGRDALGEAALLGFSYEQNHNRGVWFIAYAGAWQIKKQSGTRAPIMAAIAEGRRLGRAAAKLAHMDVAAVMRMNLSEARAMLRVGEPVVYRECLRILEDEGKRAGELMASEAAAARS